MEKVYERTGIKEEKRHLETVEKQKARKNKKTIIDYSIKRGKNKKEKNLIYQEKFERELSKAIKDLYEIKNTLVFYNLDEENIENISELINGYISHLNTYGKNFNYIELRKYRVGIIKSIKEMININQTENNDFELVREIA